MPWVARRQLAFVPLYRPNAQPPDQIPADWPNQILQRALFDPDPSTGADRSLRAYIRAASSGLADLDAVVMPMEVIDQQDVPPNALEGRLGSQLRDQGFDAAAIVMLGGSGAGSTIGFWARFVMVEGVGVWAMEFMHSLTGFGDLYPFNGNMGAFDEMACACATHPSAYTKAAIGWLNASAIARHTGRTVGYNLHSVGLVQPPPAGRSAAVRIGSQVPYLMVEARQRVDQFDRNIPSEGVIVYRVQTSDPLGHAQNNTAPIELLTTTALTAGQTFRSDTNIQVQVINALPGGFSIRIDDLTGRTSPIFWHHDQTGETQIWFMNQHQLVRRATVLGENGQPAFVGPPFRIVGVGDLDGDGQADIVWHHDQTGETQIWFMNQHQLVRRATVLGENGQPAFVGPPFRIVGVGDLDGDAQADIVWHHDQTGETQIWFMNQHQLVRRATVLGENGQPAFVGPPFRIVGVGDLDGDAQADIVWHHDQTGETQIWFMNQHQLVRRATVLGENGQPAFVGPPFRIVGVGDLDGDGQADIVWHHDQTGETQIWFMNQHQLVRRATVLGENGQPAFVGPPFRIVGASSTRS